MDNNIAIEQNEEKCMERLAAQRQLYSLAKNIFTTQFVLGLLMVILGYISAFYPQLIIGIDLVGIFAAFMVNTVLPEEMQNRKKKAASIQEIIDCDLLRIQWNKELVSRPDPEDIKKYSQKLLNDEMEKKKLGNWYEGVPGDLSYAAARVICQRSNLMWDIGLRIAFSSSIKVFSLIIVFFYLCFGCIKALLLLIYLEVLWFHHWQLLYLQEFSIIQIKNQLKK
jgi:hypothetical protein